MTGRMNETISHGLGEANKNLELPSIANPLYGSSFFQMKEDRRCTWEAPNRTTPSRINHILTYRRSCLSTSVVPSYCVRSYYCLICAMIPFNHRILGIQRDAIYAGNVLNEGVSPNDCQAETLHMIPCQTTKYLCGAPSRASFDCAHFHYYQESGRKSDI